MDERWGGHRGGASGIEILASITLPHRLGWLPRTQRCTAGESSRGGQQDPGRFASLLDLHKCSRGPALSALGSHLRQAVQSAWSASAPTCQHRILPQHLSCQGLACTRSGPVLQAVGSSLAINGSVFQFDSRFKAPLQQPHPHSCCSPSGPASESRPTAGRWVRWHRPGSQGHVCWRWRRQVLAPLPVALPGLGLRGRKTAEGPLCI